jgi:putative ABC transport system permease protein
MIDLLQDVRNAVRTLSTRPGFALVAVSTIALGIGAASAIWSVVDAVLVRPLPLSQPERLVFVWEARPDRGRDRNVAGPANLIRWRERASSFSGLAAYSRFDANLDGWGEPDRIPVGYSTGNLFTLLGTPPLLGRTLVDADSATDAPNVVVLSEGYWRSRFGADPGVLGRTLRLNGRPSTVVGVMPAHVRIPSGALIWSALTVDEGMRRARGRYLTVVGRLREGVSVAQAHDEMERIGQQLASEDPGFNANWTVNVQPLHADLVRRVRPGLLLLVVAVAMLLLIACVNVANLLLARAVAREREMAVRAALGAGRGRLLRQLLTESLVLAAIAGGLGAAVGGSMLALIQRLLPPEIAEVVKIEYDARALAGAFALTLASALLFGALPALQAARVGLVSALKEGGAVRGSGRARARVKQGLVVAEVALSAVLLVATGLLLRSFWALAAVSPGFDASGVLAATLSPGGPAYADRARVQAFYLEAIESLRRLPGVTAAGAISWTPLDSGGSATSFVVLGRQAPRQGDEPVADIRIVTPGLFQALRIPLLHGRDFTPDDRAATRRVAVVNATLARDLGGPAQAIGQRLKLWWGGDPEVEIVGVVGDVSLVSLDTASRATVYMPHAQDGNNFMTLMLRSDGSPGALAPGVRATIASLDPALPLGRAQPFEQVVSDSLRSRRFVLTLVGVLGGTALALAGIGLFGVTSYLVAQRTSEIGVRLVLGARPRDVLGLVALGGMRLVAVGLALGVAGGLLLARAFESELFGVRAWDPVAMAGVTASLALVALVSLAAPAWRAATIAPARAMRVE